MSSGIYQITNNINNKTYIGCSKNIEKRWTQHVGGNRSLISKAIRKYGKENFTFTILLYCCADYFDMWEKSYITKSDSIAPNGYNLTTGGEYRKECSDELKLKIRESLANRSEVSKKLHAERISKSSKGKTWADARRKQYSAIRTGEVKSEEHRDKIREANIAYHTAKSGKKIIFKGVEYNSIRECVRITGKDRRTIQRSATVI